MQRPTPQSLLLGVCLLAAPALGETIINLQDCVAAPDGRTTLVADIREETLLGIAKDVEGESVHFWVAGKEIGAIIGGDDGISILECTLPNDKIETIEATALVDGEKLRTEARVFRWDPARVVVVIDIDDTICKTEFDDVLLEEKDDSEAHRNSRETLHALTRDYELLYLTARPSYLLEKTRNWLAMRGFPPAPIIVSQRKRDLLNQGRYKKHAIQRMKRAWPNILIGIGDRESDAYAYGKSAMLSIIVGQERDDDFGRHCLHMRNWKTIRRFFDHNRKTLTDPEACRKAVAGEQPLLFTINPYKDDDD